MLTSNGEPIADIVPHVRRTRWIFVEWLQRQLADHAADPALTELLDEVNGTLDKL